MQGGQTHDLMTVWGSHYRRRQECCQTVWRGPVTDFHAESTDVFQVRMALTEMKIENGKNGKGEEYFGFFLNAPFLLFYSY